jgi:hypothetical protein
MLGSPLKSVYVMARRSRARPEIPQNLAERPTRAGVSVCVSADADSLIAFGPLRPKEVVERGRFASSLMIEAGP